MAGLRVVKKYTLDDLKSGRIKIPEQFRKKTKAELRREDEELQRIIKAEDNAYEQTVEGRFIQMYDAPEASELKYWRLAAFLNLILAAWTGLGGGYIFYLHLKNLKYLVLLENYDDGNLTMCTVFICWMNSSICLYGFMVTFSASFKSKTGSIRYAVYSYIGFAAAMLFVLIGTVILVGSIYLLFPHIFKTGFLLKMLKFQENLEVQKSIHFMQIDNKCCGNDNYTEWYSIRFSKELTRTLLGFPKSCCNYADRPKDQCVHLSEFSNAAKLTPWPDGCLPILFKMFKTSILYSLAVLGSTFLGELIATCLCISNMQAVKNYEDLVVKEREKIISRKHRAERVAKRERIERHGLSIPPPPPPEEKKGAIGTVIASVKKTLTGGGSDTVGKTAPVTQVTGNPAIKPINVAPTIPGQEK